MKKLIILLVLALISLSGFGQITKQWNEVYEITEATDSIYFPSKTGDVAAFPWTVTFTTEDLTDTIILDIGGGNNVLLTDSKGNILRTSFNSFANTIPTDQLPFIFEPDSCVVVTGADTTYEHTFKSPDPYGFVRPAFRLITCDDVEFTLRVNFTFSK